MEDTTAMTLGKRILYYRKRMGMTQDQLAERMGVTAQAVSKWEHDLSCPDVTALPRLAEIFGITTDQLLGITGAAPQQEGREERPKKEEKEPWRWEFRFDRAGVFFGLFLVLAGGIYLVTTILDMHVGFWSILWPTALLCLGFNSCCDRLNAFGIGAALAGGYFLLEHLGIIPDLLSWPLVLGIVLVLWGLSMVFDQFHYRKRRSAPEGHKVYCANSMERPTRDFRTENGYIHADYAFCSDRVTVQDPTFRGGDVDIAFGTLVLDLRSCTDVMPGCCLNVDVSFGSLLLLLPKCLRLESHMDRTGSSMDTTGIPDPDAQPIIFHGDCTFSSLKVQYD